MKEGEENIQWGKNNSQSPFSSCFSWLRESCRVWRMLKTWTQRVFPTYESLVESLEFRGFSGIFDIFSFPYLLLIIVCVFNRQCKLRPLFFLILLVLYSKSTLNWDISREGLIRISFSTECFKLAQWKQDLEITFWDITLKKILISLPVFNLNGLMAAWRRFLRFSRQHLWLQRKVVEATILVQG